MSSVIVSGSREGSTSSQPWNAVNVMMDALREAVELFGVDTVVTGGGRGTDAIAEDAAKRLGLNVRTYRADWATFGGMAGPARNIRMATEERKRAKLALVFPGGRGTDGFAAEAEKVGIPVVRLNWGYERGDIYHAMFPWGRQT